MRRVRLARRQLDRSACRWPLGRPAADLPLRHADRAALRHGDRLHRPSRAEPDEEDFQILDNQQPQEITVFDNTVRPITAVVMLDTSGSMTLNLDLMKAAAEQFVIRLLPEDKAMVGAFNDKIEFAERRLHQRSRRPRARHQGAGLRQRDAAVGRRRPEPRAAHRTSTAAASWCVFTDGDDTGSSTGLGQVIDRARADEVMIYAIGLESVYMRRPGRDGAHAPGPRPAADRRTRPAAATSS